MQTFWMNHLLISEKFSLFKKRNIKVANIRRHNFFVRDRSWAKGIMFQQIQLGKPREQVAIQRYSSVLVCDIGSGSKCYLDKA